MFHGERVRVEAVEDEASATTSAIIRSDRRSSGIGYHRRDDNDEAHGPPLWILSGISPVLASCLGLGLGRFTSPAPGAIG